MLRRGAPAIPKMAGAGVTPAFKNMKVPRATRRAAPTLPHTDHGTPRAAARPTVVDTTHRPTVIAPRTSASDHNAPSGEAAAVNVSGSVVRFAFSRTRRDGASIDTRSPEPALTVRSARDQSSRAPASRRA